MNFLKKIGTNLKIFLVFLGGLLGAVLYFHVRGNMKLKQEME